MDVTMPLPPSLAGLPIAPLAALPFEHPTPLAMNAVTNTKAKRCMGPPALYFRTPNATLPDFRPTAITPLPDGSFLLNSGWRLAPAGKQVRPLDLTTQE